MKARVNGIDLFYEKYGKGSSIILLHGNGENHTIFSEAVSLLKKTYTVYAIDSRGHGLSQKTNEFDYNEMAQDIIEFIHIKKIKKPFLYGFSDGGIIGLIIATKHPDLLSKLIVSGANTKPSGLKNKFVNEAKQEYEQTGSPFLKLILTQPNISAKDLKAIKIPVLLTAGEDDLVKTTHTYAIAKNIHNSQVLILSNENHDSYVIHNPLLFEIITSF
ncbi:MAG: alpha/beta hydrolase [Candidatus Riflebacteria bacterium]|nr:alpha/beta hydrolase [Candidatus Riflebacteria bacterium]